MKQKLQVCQIVFLSLCLGQVLSVQASQPEGIHVLDKSHFVLEMDQKKINHILDVQGMENLDLTPVPEDAPGVSRRASQEDLPASLKIERASDGNQVLSNWYREKTSGKAVSKNLALLLKDSRERTVLRIELDNAVPISLFRSEAKSRVGKGSEILQIKYEKLSIKHE
jgi:hypothetical protein